jgi:CRP-like cAMP-binding protein
MVEIELQAIMKTSNALEQRGLVSELTNEPVTIPVRGPHTQLGVASFFSPVAQLKPHSAVQSHPAPARLRAVDAKFVRSLSIPVTGLRATPSPDGRSQEVVTNFKANSPLQNRLLAALSPAELNQITPHLELVKMSLGDVLYESGGRLQHVFFPTTSIVSLLYVLEDGASTEIAAVGNEGILGVSTFMGGDTTPSRAVVQSEGYGYRINTHHLKQEFERTGRLFRLLLRYTQALMTQTAQMAVCNRHHSLEQQLCRRLLFSLDRLPTDSLFMTQELIANMLGVRREGVTAAAGNLQRAGLIRYSRGRIDILDRNGLESAVCECYGVVKLEFNRLLSDDHRSDPFHSIRQSAEEVNSIPYFASQNSVGNNRNMGSSSYA